MYYDRERGRFPIQSIVLPKGNTAARLQGMEENGILRRDVAKCPGDCTCPQVGAAGGVDRLLRAVFSMPALPPSPLLRQRLRQRIAYEDSLWRARDRLTASPAEGSAKFFTLPLERPGCPASRGTFSPSTGTMGAKVTAKECRHSDYRSAYPPEARN